MARAKYLVTWQDVATGESGAFYTSWFDSDKYNPDLQMVKLTACVIWCHSMAKHGKTLRMTHFELVLLNN